MYYKIVKVLCCRATRRQSLSEIGFGRIDTYTKLDKLGEVRYRCVEYVGGDVQGVFFNWAYPLDWAPPKVLRLAPP